MTTVLRTVVIIGLAALPVGSAAQAPAPARAVLARAGEVLGVDRLQSLQLSGHGSDFLFGQAYDGNSAWPRFHLSRYIFDIDYVSGGVRDERVRNQAQDPPRGGGNQPIAEQRQVWSYRDGIAWNGEGASASAAGLERDRRPAAEARSQWALLTPHGFVRAALAAGADVVVASRGTGRNSRVTVTLKPSGGAPLVATLTPDGLVERIHTWASTPVLGDTLFDATFYDYRDVDGFKVPRRIVQRQGGYPVLDVVIATASVNVRRDIEVPAHLRAPRATAAASDVAPQQLAPGVWHVAVGPRDRVVAVEFADHIVVVEAPQGEAESLSAIEQIRRVIAGKPIRYVINTHIHFDHSGGLRAYAAEGATVVTHASNVPYYEQVWANPWTLHRDRLAASGRTPQFIGIVGSRTFTDGAQTLVVYHYAGNDHHPGMLMVHLPAERILVEADSFNPPNDPDARPNAVSNLAQFYDAVTALRLDVDLLVPTHGRLTTLEEARRAIDTFWPGGGR